MPPKPNPSRPDPARAFSSERDWATGASSLRRQPTQDRAQHTIHTIFEATAQIVERDGVDGTTTNKVAAQAGFSIGTLYQYFRSKDAIFQAMARQGRQVVMNELVRYLEQVEALDQPQQLDPTQFFREFIRLQVAGLGAGGRLGRAGGFRRSMIRLCWTLERPEDTQQAVRQISERISICLQRIKHPLLREPTPALTYTMAHAMLGVVRSASLERSPLLGSPELEDELLRMIWGLMGRHTLDIPQPSTT